MNGSLDSGNFPRAAIFGLYWENRCWEVKAKNRVRPTSPAELEDESTDEAITEIEGEGRAGVTALEDPGEQPVEAELPTHTFEKAETLEETNGLNRKSDDEDELEDHEEALRSLQMTQVMRSRERPRSIYRADLVIEGLHLEVGGEAPAAGIPYPEWDFKQGRHKDDWCFIRETAAEESDAEWASETARKHRSVILDLRKNLASLATKMERKRSRPHGEDLDLDSVVRSLVDLRAGQIPDEQITSSGVGSGTMFRR